MSPFVGLNRSTGASPMPRDVMHRWCHTRRPPAPPRPAPMLAR